MGEFSKFEYLKVAMNHNAGGCRSGLVYQETAVLAALWNYADADTGVAWPSRDRLAAELGVSPGFVTKWIKSLIGKGWLFKVSDESPGVAARYRLSMPVGHVRDGVGHVRDGVGHVRDGVGHVRDPNRSMNKSGNRSANKSGNGYVSNASASAQDSPSAAAEKELVDCTDLLDECAAMFRTPLQSGLGVGECSGSDGDEQFVYDQDFYNDDQDDWSAYADQD